MTNNMVFRSQRDHVEEGPQNWVFFNFGGHFLAELQAANGEHNSAALALLLLMISYFSGNKKRGTRRQFDEGDITDLSSTDSGPLVNTW